MVGLCTAVKGHGNPTGQTKIVYNNGSILYGISYTLLLYMFQVVHYNNLFGEVHV